MALKSGPRDLQLEVSPASRLFWTRFCENGGEADLELVHVEQFFDDRLESAADRAELVNFRDKEATDFEIRQRRACKVVHAKAKRGKKLAPLELLMALHSSLEREHTELSFDYLSFHQKCWSLLEDVHKAVHEDLVDYVDPKVYPRENELPFVVGLIFASAHHVDKTAREILKMKEGRVTSKLLHAACQVVQQWVDTCEEADGRRGSDADVKGMEKELAIVTNGN